MQSSSPLSGAAPILMAGLARWLPGALGAGIAITLTGYATHLLMAGESAAIWLVASMGATAVLVFVVPPARWPNPGLSPEGTCLLLPPVCSPGKLRQNSGWPQVWPWV